MQKSIFKTLAKINKTILPSFTKQRLDLSKAKKWQMALFGYRLWVTKKALDWIKKKQTELFAFFSDHGRIT